MSGNSSSSSSSQAPPSLFLSSGLYYVTHTCMNSTVGTVNITAFTITSMLLILPVCVLTLHLGLQQWRRQGSGSTIGHSDLFTYHAVVMETLNITGSILCCCGVHLHLYWMVFVGIPLLGVNSCGQVYFSILTCVERYLAVVHPITYRDLRRASMIRGRNVTVGCVWLLSFVSTPFLCLTEKVSTTSIFFFCALGIIFIVICFFSISVLFALIRPGPAGGVGGRQQVDQSKLRAFYTIMVILGALVLRFVGNALAFSEYFFPHFGVAERCGMWYSVLWFSLPSSLVLPLLFLHRAGKLRCCKKTTESGGGSD